MTPFEDPRRRAPPAIKLIIFTGLIAGLLDITMQAILFATRGRSPVYLLQVIAGGLLGKSTYSDGWRSAALGAFCHFLIAITAAALFYFASRRMLFLVGRPVLFGILFGTIVYAFMRFIVLPLSAYKYPLSLPPISILARDVAIHMLLIGLPISLMISRYSAPQLTKPEAAGAAR